MHYTDDMPWLSGDRVAGVAIGSGTDVEVAAEVAVGVAAGVGGLGTCVHCNTGSPVKARGRCNNCYGRWLTRQKAYGKSRLFCVHESGVYTRVTALMQEAGFTPRDLAQMMELPQMVIQKIYREDAQQVKKVSRETRDAVLSVKPAEQWGAGEIERTKVALSTTRSRVASGARSARLDSNDGLRVNRLVRAEGSTRRLQALAVIGWSRAQLSKYSGLSQDNVIGPVMRGSKARVNCGTARVIAELYDHLSMMDPKTSPGGFCEKTAKDAIHRGWLPPLAWDDGLAAGVGCIDDPSPTAVPAQAGRVRNRATRLERVSQLGGKEKVR